VDRHPSTIRNSCWECDVQLIHDDASLVLDGGHYDFVLAKDGGISEASLGRDAIEGWTYNPVGAIRESSLEWVVGDACSKT